MDTELSMECIDVLSSNDSGVTVVTSDSLVRNDAYCEDAKIEELEERIVDLQGVIHKYKQIIESQQKEIASLKNKVETRDAKQLANLKNVNDHLKIITKNEDDDDKEDVKDKINDLLIEKSNDAQVGANEFGEFLEFTAFTIALKEKFNNFMKVRQTLKKEKDEWETIAELMRLERMCAEDELKKMRGETAAFKEENTKLAEESSNLKTEIKELEGQVAFLELDHEREVKEMQQFTEELKDALASLESEATCLKKKNSVLSEEYSCLEKEKKGVQEIMDFMQFSQDITFSKLKILQSEKAAVDKEKTDLLNSKADLLLKIQVRKRQVMHNTFGNYRKKMAQELKKGTASATKDPKFIAVDGDKLKQSVFIKSKVDRTTVRHPEATGWDKGGLGDAPNYPGRDFENGLNEQDHIAATGDTSRWRFQPSDNSFAFSFTPPASPVSKKRQESTAAHGGKQNNTTTKFEHAESFEKFHFKNIGTLYDFKDL
eukprot:gene15220-16794_t